MNKHLATTSTMAAWTLAVGGVGYASGLTSPGALAAMIVLTCAPPLLMLGLWRAPQPSMSESIQKELRR